MFKKLNFKKKNGFIGEKAIILPPEVVTNCAQLPFINSLYITDIGYYPNAYGHYRERRKGIDQHILIFCDEGCGEGIIENRKFQIRANNFLIIPAFKAHRYKASDNHPWSIYWMHFKGFNGDAISNMLYDIMLENKNVIILKNRLISTYNKIFYNLQLGYSYNNLITVTFYLHYFFSLLLVSNKQQIKGIFDENIEKAINYMKLNITKNLTLREIADYVHLAPAYFSHKFKLVTGYSPIQYFNHLKLQKACQLLLFSNKRINEISYEIGFEDPYYFSRLFKQYMGISPKEYRIKNKI